MKFCKDCAHHFQPQGILAAMPGAPFCKAEATRYAVDVVTGNRRMRGCRDPVLLTKTLEGARIACAWVLRA